MSSDSAAEAHDADVAALARLASEYGMDCITAVEDSAFDSTLLTQLPVEWARAHEVLPVYLNGTPVLLLGDPASVDKQAYVSLVTGLDLQPVLTLRNVVLSCIESAYFSKDSSPSDFIDDLGENASQFVVRRKADDLLEMAKDAPVTQLINLILLDAFKQRASDIHVEPFEDRLRVRYRVDGVLYEQSSPPSHMIAPLVSRLKVMAHMDIAERRLPQDGMARVRVGEREVDIRVSTVPVTEGERVVLRLLDKSNTRLRMSDLGMAGDCFERFRSLLEEPHGMIVVSGPTGSGKTTTLYAALGALDASRRNILTIEDPIEYQLDNIGQIQVKTKIGLNFSNGLRHILRQDPDVILVGETRDSETAEIAIRASLTGHLVFTTLHTNDAPGAVIRLMDMGIEPYLLAACLRGILAQRLVRRLCPYCRQDHVVRGAEADGYGKLGEAVRGKRICQAVGCEHCTDGYRGRIGIFELLEVTSELRASIREGAGNLEVLRDLITRGGFATLVDDGVEKVLEGFTTIDEILTTTPS